MEKGILKSKRFWTGLIALITGISLIFTGDKAFNDVLPELVLTLIGLVQTIIGVTSKKEIKGIL